MIQPFLLATWHEVFPDPRPILQKKKMISYQNLKSNQFWFDANDFYIFLHMPWQHSCHGMCKIM